MAENSENPPQPSSHDPASGEGQVPEELLQSLNLGFRRKKKRISQSDRERIKADKQKNEAQQKAEAQQKKQEEYASFPPWLVKMKPFQILLLPYSEVPYSHDFYEKALIMLYRRRWKIVRIYFMHFFIISPIFWPPYFSYSKTLGWKRFFWRWFIVLSIPTALIYALYGLLYASNYLEIHKPLSLIIVVSYALIHFLGGYEDFRKWKRAYLSLSDKLQKRFGKKRKKKK